MLNVLRILSTKIIETGSFSSDLYKIIEGWPFLKLGVHIYEVTTSA